MTRLQEIETWIGEAVGELPASGARPVSVKTRRRVPRPLESFAEGTVPDGQRPGVLDPDGQD